MIGPYGCHSSAAADAEVAMVMEMHPNPTGMLPQALLLSAPNDVDDNDADKLSIVYLRSTYVLSSCFTIIHRHQNVRM